MDKNMIILLVILFINIIAFLLFAIDKLKAIKGRWRIPEKTLLIWSLFAPFGGYLGMKLTHHKTNKNKFKITVPILMIVHIAVFTLYIYYKLV